MNRRKFVYSTAVIAGASAMVPAFGAEPQVMTEANSGNILLGVITAANDPEKDLKMVGDLGFSTCQLSINTYSPELAVRLSKSLETFHLKPTTLICMGPGVYKWNLTEGPSTIGLVPREYRAERVERLKQGTDFCQAAGIPAVHAHFGFIPEDPKDILYREFIETMKPLGEYARQRGIDIYFETGQETPVTLLRAIEDIGTGNLFVNYDTANLVMYGKANALDGLKVIGKYVKELHAKDGTYPVNPYELGREVPIPEGEVDFPAVISYLKKLNFNGSITIECELAGHKKDYILQTKNYLQGIISAS